MRVSGKHVNGETSMLKLGVSSRILDVLLVAAGAFLAHLLRFGAHASLGDAERFMIAFDCALVLLVFPTFEIYRSWRGQALAPLLWRVLGAWSVVTVIGLLFAYSLHRADVISRLWLGFATLLSGALLLLEKTAVHAGLRKLRSHGINQKKIAIVGPESYSRTVLSQLDHAVEAGFQTLCLFDESAPPEHTVCGIEVLSRFDDLAARVRRRELDEIWLALPLSEEHTIQRFLREFRHDFVDLRFLPDIRAVSLFTHSVADVAGMPAINLTASPISEPELWPKLLFDRVFAALVLIPMLPLLLVLALLVKLSSPGPVLFKQKRKGVDGRQFSIFKFRTMKLHTDKPGQLVQAARNDTRITPVGAFLRRTSLDELPQFVNVLLGQMSVVGPRPHAIEHDNLYKDLVDGYMYRYRVKPGITGWAQVNGYRGETRKVEKMEARVKFDLFYMQNWSFWFDLKIIFLTIFKGFTGRNAF
jgi:putative colanic acid biosynthesis UDP-glucose lipid carrier transferase